MRPRPTSSSATRSRRPLADIPAANFFSLDVSASAQIEAEPDYPSASPPVQAVMPSSSRVTEEQPALGSERAWFRGEMRFRSPMLQLHKADHEFSKTHSCLYDFEMDNLTDAVLRYCLFTAEVLDFDEQDVVQQVQEFYADFCAIDPLPFHFEHSK
ncbi:hypothetical protein ACP70R_025351 [Stipagrostis hirtigluma subsp. patula]